MSRRSRSLTAAFDPESRSDYVSGNVYGPRIAQDPTWARRFPADGALPIVPLFTLDDAPPLAQLIANSRRLASERTAVSLLRLAHDPTLPDAVTFTFLAQAVEGLHRDANIDAENRRAADYRERRTNVLNVIGQAGLAKERQWIRDNLSTRPRDNLAARLRELLSMQGLEKTARALGNGDAQAR